ncbi:prepilin-type N-terminal cleavage/methylation domain-containing protein [Herbaspirillum seropedicae]|uniref:PulJ/GspJ family protein n=1 Tax=Herbaspirillum seropedicae TaxID=964 RepID=UPI001123C143|nr:prepilin-type N-terminal cleavage/methylation domain-containing protein [Herbaspirillum seropedicae]QDD65244.1 prepilin-type N-terminal cleavage/methylation domain-containing protein [Herbaspirillum seropedicae]
MRKNHSGYTLVELSVAVAVAGMIVLASVAGAVSLVDQQRISDLTAQNADAIKRVNDAYVQLPNYDGLSLRQAVSFGAFRQFAINRAGTPDVTVTHPFGGAVGITPLAGAAPLAWGLYLNAIPAKYCTEVLFQSGPIADALVVFPDGMNNPAGWTGNIGINRNVPEITVLGGLGSTAPVIAKNLTTDLAPSALARACNFAGTSFGVLLLKSKLR